MAYLGEILSIGVALAWTVASLWSETGSKRLGAQVMNTWRLGLSALVSLVVCLIFLGAPYPVYASGGTWLILAVSGFIGFFLGDLCLLGSYVVMGARLGQLFMTLAPAFAAIFALFMLGQKLAWNSLLAMAVTMVGIGITVLGHGEKRLFSLQIPLKGALLGVGAALGQGLGLILSGIGLQRYLADVPADILPKIEIGVPFFANTIRCLTGFAASALMLAITRPERSPWALFHDRKSAVSLAIVVVTGPVIGVGLSLMALRYTAAGIASTLQSMTPILMLLPAHRMFGEKITLRSVIGAVVSVAGVSLFFLL